MNGCCFVVPGFSVLCRVTFPTSVCPLRCYRKVSAFLPPSLAWVAFISQVTGTKSVCGHSQVQSASLKLDNLKIQCIICLWLISLFLLPATLLSDQLCWDFLLVKLSKILVIFTRRGDIRFLFSVRYQCGLLMCFAVLCVSTSRTWSWKPLWCWLLWWTLKRGAPLSL